jgi:transposase
MQYSLTDEEREFLRKQHRQERDGRVRDRLKVVLLKDMGWTYALIAEALFLDEDTVGRHLKEYRESHKLKGEHPGAQSKLTDEQANSLVGHLTAHTYSTTKAIRAYVYNTYGIKYSHQGMYEWLKRNEFSYKKPKGVPRKACPEKQAQFIDKYEELMKKIMKNESADKEVVYFMDSVHPTMATKISYGWIKKGHANNKQIQTTGSRTRVNLTGALNLEDMSVVHKTYETIDNESFIDFMDDLGAKNPGALKIHVILDNGPAHTGQKILDYLKNSRIELHYLPTYSLNLNPIERVWKVMNELVRNNVFFNTAREFRDAINRFFEVLWPERAYEFVDRINDNFEKINPAHSEKIFKPAFLT